MKSKYVELIIVNRHMYFDKFVNVIVEIVQIFVFLKTCLDVNTQYAMYIKIIQKYFIGISFI